MRISAARKTISARRGAGTRRHLANARLAASTAASTSALFERWKMATTSRVSAGLRSSKVCPPADSTHSPSMKFLQTLVLVVPPSITGLVKVSVAIEDLLGIVLNFNANNRGEDGQARAVSGNHAPQHAGACWGQAYGHRDELPSASRRNNTVHAQVFHHLTVVIVGVCDHVLGELKTGPLPVARKGSQGF